MLNSPQPESADAACFPLTSQHSAVQTQWTCRWQLGTSAGSIHFTIRQLWCDHSALAVSAINVCLINSKFKQTMLICSHKPAISCCAHVQGFEQLGQLVFAPLTKPNVEKYSSCSFNPDSQARKKHPYYYYDWPYSHLTPSHFREEGSGFKAVRIVNTQDPAFESRRYKDWAAPSLDEQCLEEDRILQEEHHNLTIEEASPAWAAGQGRIRQRPVTHSKRTHP